MRLSEIKGEAALDVVADILEPIANIAIDENSRALFTNVKVNENLSDIENALNHWKKHLPKLIKSHKKDLINILAPIAGVTYEQYVESMTLMSLIKECTELLTDEVFSDLFIAAQNQVQE